MTLQEEATVYAQIRANDYAHNAVIASKLLADDDKAALVSTINEGWSKRRKEYRGLVRAAVVVGVINTATMLFIYLVLAQ